MENEIVINRQSIVLNDDFKKLMKIGIYKELHKKGLLSDYQLNTLIKMQNCINDKKDVQQNSIIQ